MPPKQAAYLFDMLRSVQAIQQYLAGYSIEEFFRDGKTQDTCAEFPNIPLANIAGMRNRPRLLTELQRFLATFDQE